MDCSWPHPPRPPPVAGSAASGPRGMETPIGETGIRKTASATSGPTIMAVPAAAIRRADGDASYRYPIHLKLTSQPGANESAFVLPFFRSPAFRTWSWTAGPGHFICYAYAYAITPVAAASMLSLVQDTIDQTVACLNHLVGITEATTITTTAGSTQTHKERQSARRSPQHRATSTIGQVGNPLIIEEIAAAIRNSSSRILDVGSAPPPDRGGARIVPTSRFRR